MLTAERASLSAHAQTPSAASPFPSGCINTQLCASVEHQSRHGQTHSMEGAPVAILIVRLLLTRNAPMVTSPFHHCTVPPFHIPTVHHYIIVHYCMIQSERGQKGNKEAAGSAHLPRLHHTCITLSH
eukprot:388453-Pelagomonas_calceolata.AAC.3